MDWNLEVIREGSNDWTCLPDRPDTPGNDPWCVTDLGSHDHALFGRRRAHASGQDVAIFWRQHNRSRWTGHAASLRSNVEPYK